MPECYDIMASIAQLASRFMSHSQILPDSYGKSSIVSESTLLITYSTCCEKQSRRRREN